jgi:hypothetical protein
VKQLHRFIFYKSYYVHAFNIGACTRICIHLNGCGVCVNVYVCISSWSLNGFRSHIIFPLGNGRKRAYHRIVLSYKNTLGYVNNNMFASAIRKINTPRDPCQVLRTTTRHVSVLISLNALPPVQCFRARKSIATLHPIPCAITKKSFINVGLKL